MARGGAGRGELACRLKPDTVDLKGDYKERRGFEGRIRQFLPRLRSRFKPSFDHGYQTSRGLTADDVRARF